MKIETITKNLRELCIGGTTAGSVRANVIAHLATYQRSVQYDGVVDVGSLFGAYSGLSWLTGYLEGLNSTPPSVLKFLGQALASVFELYEQHRGV